MDETILFPSPNWFQTSGLVVTEDDWLIYGGPSKSLCVLVPVPQDFNSVVRGAQTYRAHVLTRAHPEKIVCVSIPPEWPSKRTVLTGSSDGAVKQWHLEQVSQSLKMKTTHSHDIHNHQKEEVAGVGYCNNGYAVTVGSHGHIVKWDLTSNVIKSYNNVLKTFKPVCMACSPHVHLNVAIGTKQGVIFVLDLNGAARVIYKVRGQDDEISKLYWCPQYEVALRKTLIEVEKESVATKRMQQIRHEPEHPAVLKELEKRVAAATENYPKHESIQEKVLHEQGCDIQLEKQVVELTEHSPKPEPTLQDKVSDDQPEYNESEQPVTNSELSETTKQTEADESGIGKTLPEDSFDESIVVEDDMFDIYKDHAADEFGHKKYQPEYLVVKVKQEITGDYLAECSKLREEILEKKNQTNSSIEALVNALDKTHVDGNKNDVLGTSKVEGEIVGPSLNEAIDTLSSKTETSSVHIQRHLLASISKFGSVRIWSKAGKLVSSCAVTTNKNQKNQKNTTNWTTLLWYKPGCMLIGDGKSQLLECNPLIIDSKNKLQWSVVHSLHKRGICAIVSSAPRIQTDADSLNYWDIWTTSQDRSLIRYSMKTHQTVSLYNTCGGFVYYIRPCPYDAKKVAMSVGDGAVRVWETDTLDEDEMKLSHGHVTTYWQNVQGKVLTVAWHPTKENWLAFGTAESRVGIIDPTGKQEKPARVLPSALTGGVYSLYWGDENNLYACGGGEVVIYKVDKPDEAPTPFRMELEGQKWSLTIARWYPHALVCGSLSGAVAVLTASQPHAVLAATFVFNKSIHTIDWHPQETSSSSEESPYKNLIAVCSVDKVNTIVILQYKEDGIKELSTWKTLAGHKGSVLQLAWNPHIDGQLLSTSQDGTVRIWQVAEGECLSIFGGHSLTTLGAAWSAYPQLSGLVLSGGADCCLRLWDRAHHAALAYCDSVEEPVKKDRRRKNKKGGKKLDQEKPEEDEELIATEEDVIALQEAKLKASNKFLVPMIQKQISNCKVNAPRKLLRQYLEKKDGQTCGSDSAPTEEYDLDFLKIFGSINDVNDVLNTELERHEDTGKTENWMMLSIFRGHIDAMVQFATQRDLLDPYLLSIAPCVSVKYWKDVSQLYLSQIDRLVAKGEEPLLHVSRTYGGAVYRKAATLLSLQDVKGAVAVLLQARLFPEAYVLCRTRYIDSIAEETLQYWAHECARSGNFNMAAVCYIVLDNLSQASEALAKSSDESSLNLAAEIAKIAGQNIYAEHIEKKREQIKSNKPPIEENSTALKELPLKADLLLKDGTQKDYAEKIMDAVKTEKREEELLDDLHTKMAELMQESHQNDENKVPNDKDCVNGDENKITKKEAQDETMNGTASVESK